MYPRSYEDGATPSGTTFADVAGCDEAKGQSAPIVLLSNPNQF
jgi:ATP-dependent Zn protease